ncbi:conserved hypothetical protein [Luteimonas sp. 9C]|uniref:hypothetical protein n=1 Tax=Luteimonas sp. 9C TaxID=2653148 RepID=UPI0012F24EA0|nr:hypothetical protein [Luteimonas sp. 9C]VXC03141.1 conserved hypothetical protein [Luteimonas sp. 9C]
MPASTRAANAGFGRSARIGRISLVVEGEQLRLTAGDVVVLLHPESTTRFFARDRDLRFAFETGAAARRTRWPSAKTAR